MTTLLMATADAGAPPGYYTWGSTVNTMQISASQARTGSKSFYTQFTTVSGAFRMFFPQITPTEIYFRFAIRHASTSNTRLAAAFNVMGPNLLQDISSGTSVKIRNGTSVLHTLAGVIIPSQWRVYEVKATTTTITVRLDGVEVYHGTGLTVDLTDLSYIDFSSAGCMAYWDDIVVCTDKWPGLGGLHVFTPTGPGIVTDWSDSLPNLNTPAAASGTKHLFTHDNAPATAALVHRVGVGCTAKVNGQGYGAIKPLLNNDAGTEQALSVSSQYFQQYWPGMSVADFNASEIGVQSA